MTGAFEHVLRVDDWHDGVRGGVALCQGVPHHFRWLGWESASWDPVSMCAAFRNSRSRAFVIWTFGFRNCRQVVAATRDGALPQGDPLEVRRPCEGVTGPSCVRRSTSNTYRPAGEHRQVPGAARQPSGGDRAVCAHRKRRERRGGAAAATALRAPVACTGHRKQPLDAAIDRRATDGQ